MRERASIGKMPMGNSTWLMPWKSTEATTAAARVRRQSSPGITRRSKSIPAHDKATQASRPARTSAKGHPWASATASTWGPKGSPS